MPLARGLLAYQLQPGVPLSPCRLRTSGNTHSPSTIWTKSQSGGKSDWRAREVSRARLAEVYHRPPSEVSAPPAHVMGTQQGEDSHLSADPTLCLFAISSDHLFSTKALSHGLLSFCAWEGLSVWASSSIFTIFNPQSIPSSLNWSPVPLYQVVQSPTETWTGSAAPRRALLSLTPVPIKSKPIFMCFFQPAENAWHLDNLGHTLQVWGALRKWSLFPDVPLEGGHHFPKATLLWWPQFCVEAVFSDSRLCQSRSWRKVTHPTSEGGFLGHV